MRIASAQRRSRYPEVGRSTDALDEKVRRGHGEIRIPSFGITAQ